jgi:hypothetical protein
MSRTKIASYYYNLGRQQAARDIVGGRTKTAAKISPSMLKRLGIGAGVAGGVGGGAYGINKLLTAKALQNQNAAAKLDALMIDSPGSMGRMLAQFDDVDQAIKMTGLPEAGSFRAQLARDAAARQDVAAAAKMDALMGGSPSSIGRALASSKDPELAANLLGLPEAGSFKAQLAGDAAARAAAAAEESRMVHEMIPNIIKMLGEHGPGQVSKSINDVVSKGLISPRAGRMYNLLVDDYRAMEPVTESLLKAKGAISPYFGSISSPFFPNAEVASRMDIQNKIMDSLSAPGLGLKNTLPLPL